jgi:hypothetical protein
MRGFDMNKNVPEALAVLDDVLSFTSDALPYTHANLRKARSAFAELYEIAALVRPLFNATRIIIPDKELRDHAGECCDRLQKALAPVEKLS